MHNMTWGRFIFHLSLSFIFVTCFASFLQFRIWHGVRKSKAVEFEKSRESGFHPVTGSALGHMSETFLHVMFCMMCFQITNLHLFHIYVGIYTCVCVCVNIYLQIYLMARNVDVLENETPHLVYKGWEEDCKQTIEVHQHALILASWLYSISESSDQNISRI